MSATRQPAADRSEAGFTLPEVLIAVSVLAVVVAALSGAVITGLRTSDRTASVLVASADRQLLTTYLPPDALSASAATTDPGATGGCSGTTGSRILLLTWSEFTGAVTSYASDYRLVVNGTDQTLVRTRCIAGSTGTPLTVARDAPTATAQVTSGTVSITVTDSLATSYTVSGTRRVA